MTATKDLISLAGQLDWRVRNGRSLKDVKPIIKQMRTKLTNVEFMLDDTPSKESGRE